MLMEKMARGIFVGATGQNVGKTTLCLGIMSLLSKHFSDVGFIKPVGQIHVQIREGLSVDKDVALFKEYFKLPADYKDMSPVIFSSNFTREYLDGKVQEVALYQKITKAYQNIVEDNEFTLVEGTGHIGVGSIVNLSNAKVASLLGLDVVLIATGGLGSAHDELALNIGMCQQYGIKVRGVILNRVQPDKKAMLENYFPQALKHWGIPLIGCVPFNQILNSPSMRDFELLFKAESIAGDNHSIFEHTRLVGGSLDTFQDEAHPNELFIIPATRDDLIYCTVERYEKHRNQEGDNWTSGLILTGRTPPNAEILRRLRQSGISSLYASVSSYDAMKMITSFKTKIRTDTPKKISEALKVVESNIQLDFLL